MVTLQEKEDYLFCEVLNDIKEFVCFLNGINNKKERIKIKEELAEYISDRLYMCKSPTERVLYLACLSMPDTICYKDIIPQYKIGNYIADIVWKPQNGNLVVFEADGHDFHEKTKEQAAHDKERDRFMLSNGIKVYRFTGSEIFNNTMDVLLEVQKILQNEFENLPE